MLGTLRAPKVDLDGDGQEDLIWVDQGSGTTVAWLMSGTATKASGILLTHPTYRIVAVADFDGDGKSDLVWLDPQSGTTVIWLMNGLTIRQQRVMLVDGRWRVIGTPDLNGDGKADILWQDSGRDTTALWLMSGTDVLSSKSLLTHPDFRVVALDDFDGDKKADLVWYSAASGQSVIWLMDGGTIRSSTVVLTHPSFKPLATADLNGDGRADLLWLDPVAGQTVAWLMNGSSMQGFGTLLTHPSFRLTATPDLDGDGKADLLWYDPASGQTVAWLMDGASVKAQSVLVKHPSFQVVATPRLNADRQSDLVWFNPVSGETLAWTMNGLASVGTQSLLVHPSYRVTATQWNQRANATPVALAGADVSLPFGQTTVLDAASSYDLDGDKLSYRWTLTAAPARSAYVGFTTTSPRLTVGGDVPGRFTWTLEVSDGAATAVASVNVMSNAAPPPAGWTLSGNIAIPDSAAVDSDTNNPFQVGAKSNDTLSTAQALRSPVMLLGHVNKAFKGATDGRNYVTGDEDDYYSVELSAGQTIELEFPEDAADNDVDLFIYDPVLEQVVGESIGVRQYECVTVTASGRFVVVVNAYEGASLYTLRVGLPNESTGCSNRTSAQGVGLSVGHVIARASTDRAEAGAASARRLAAAGVQGADALNTSYPTRLSLPAAASQRARVLGGLQADTALARRAQAAPGVGAADRQRPAPLQALMDTVALAKRTAAMPGVAYAEPERLESLHAILGNFPPNDRNYPSQRWHYEMINLPAAMQRLSALANPPTQRPLVAVIDTGIVGDHPDLSPQIEGGYSFISSATGGGNTASPEDPSRKGDRGAFHGSHVAGTIAASTFDGVGVAGVAPMAKLMPLRVFAPGEFAASYDIVQAILYAAGLDNGSGRKPARRADVINMSLGGGSTCPAYYQDAINRAIAQGVIVVAAAGNESLTSVSAPASCTGVISVSALDAQRRLAFYSNSGTVLSVAAPGGDLTVATSGRGEPDGVFSSYADFDSQGRRFPSVAFLQGTSMASPHVAGVMALMRYANPSITPAQVQALLSNGQLTTDIGPVGRDNSYGWGLIDARKAVDAALAAAGNGGAPEGSVVASPSALDFGSLRTSVELALQLSAAGTERVLSVTPSNTALAVTASKIDAATRLGTYTVTLNRSALTGSVQYSLSVVTNKRSFTIAVTASKAATGASSGSYGRLYVLAVDPATGKAIYSTPVEASGGRYVWSITGVKVNAIRLYAGTDNDNDGFICQGGEACGLYAGLSVGQSNILQVNSAMSDLNFEVAPLGGLGARPTGKGGAGADRGGLGRPRE